MRRFGLMVCALLLAAGVSAQKYEVENEKFYGAKAATAEKGFSGTGYVEFTAAVGAYVNVPVVVKDAGEYAVQLTFSCKAAESWAGVRVDYDDSGYVCSQRLPATKGFATVYMNAPVTFSKGAHTLKISAINRPWLLDSVELKKVTPDIRKQISPSSGLAVKNPTKEAQALYDYLCAMRGKGIIAGQQIYSAMTDIDVLEKATGKSPAIMGIDLIDYSPSRVEHGAIGSVIRKAKSWAKKGGIITCAWHWNAPAQLVDKDEPELHWYDGFRAKATTFDFTKGLKDKNSEEYKLLLRDIDAIAVQLKSLKDANIPVLWRPVHEASGGWFWWGAKGAENYKELYRLVFDRLTNYHGLNNLIWVWNGQNPNWYPGDEYVDVLSYDTYPGKRIYGTFHGELQLIQTATTQPKLCALSENGPLPNVDELAKEKSVWSWFCTWNGEFVEQDGKYSETYTDLAALRRFYNNDYLITLDRLNVK